MRRWKRGIAVALAGTLLLAGTPRAAAADAAFKGVFQDAFYGGLTGALVGGAILAFDHNSQEDMRYVLYGAAAGVIVGTVFGLVGSTRPLAELEGGRLRLAVPTIVPVPVPGPGGRVALLVGAELFRARY